MILSDYYTPQSERVPVFSSEIIDNMRADCHYRDEVLYSIIEDDELLKYLNVLLREHKIDKIKSNLNED